MQKFTVSKPSHSEVATPKTWPHREMPPRNADEEVKMYVVKVKDKFPRKQYVTLLGQIIPHYYLPADASYVDQKDKTHAPKVPMMALTQRQLNALVARAKEVEEFLPAAPNHDYHKDKTQPEFFDEIRMPAIEFIDIMPLEEWQAKEAAEFNASIAEFNTHIEEAKPDPTNAAQLANQAISEGLAEQSSKADFAGEAPEPKPSRRGRS